MALEASVVRPRLIMRVTLLSSAGRADLNSIGRNDATGSPRMGVVDHQERADFRSA